VTNSDIQLLSSENPQSAAAMVHIIESAPAGAFWRGGVKCRIVNSPTNMPVKAPAKSIGKVVHYYDKLGVAIIELASSLKVGDTVKFQRGEQEFTQEVDSLQIEHESVEKAKKGEFVGIKVSEPAKEGTVVLRA
tara:strand:- start:197 stop:598 length:402 start_codon:yes stop_codon:yes gene_type:complete